MIQSRPYIDIPYELGSRVCKKNIFGSKSEHELLLTNLWQALKPASTSLEREK
jgi:hypothetical protein